MKSKKVSLVILTMFLLIGILAAPASAWQMRGHDENGAGSAIVTIESDEVIDDDLLLVGRKVRIDGIVNGDVAVFADMVDVAGTINGDLLAGCNNLNISGNINDDVRIGAQNVLITGNIKRNMSAGAARLIVDKAALVGGNAAVGAGDLSIEGLIQGGLQAGVGQLSLSGEIGQNANISTDDLNILPGAVIGGSLSYRGATEGNISPQAQIEGPVTYKYFVDQAQQDKPAWTGIVIWTLLWFVSLMLVWLLWFYLGPVSLAKVRNAWLGNFWGSLGWGLFLLILIPVAAVIVMATVIGIPIALAVLTVYAAILFASKLIVGYGLVYYLAHRYQVPALQKPFAAAALGTLVLLALSAVPWVGIIVTAAAVLIALGSVFIACKEGLAARKAAPDNS